MTYTQDETENIRKYQESTDPDVLEFVRNVMNGDDKINYITIAFMPDTAVDEIEKLTGKKVRGSRIVLDINAINHIKKGLVRQEC